MRKVTVIFTDDAENYRVVDFDADTFSLVGSEGEHAVYVITKFSKNSHDEASNIFFNFDSVLAIGFSEHIKPLVKKFKPKKDEDPDKYIL